MTETKKPREALTPKQFLAALDSGGAEFEGDVTINNVTCTSWIKISGVFNGNLSIKGLESEDHMEVAAQIKGQLTMEQVFLFGASSGNDPMLCDEEDD